MSGNRASVALVLWHLVLPTTFVAQQENSGFDLAGLDVMIVGDLQGFELSTERFSDEDGLEIVRITLQRANPAVPPEFELRWAIPSHDIQGHWTTGAHFNKTINPNWAPSRVRSMLARNAPILTLFGAGDTNRLTFAVSDGLNSTILSAAVREEDGTIVNAIRFFSERHSAVSELVLEVLFDRRAIPYYNAIANVGSWWADHDGYQPATIPEYARRPMYSTWYSYHQNVAADELLREVEIARSIGFESIIVDDGWQTMDSRRGYAYTGDWQPERIPRMRGFVDGVHERGMKILLWYALSLVGEESAAYARFQGKYLRYWNGQGAYELDPRYPEVREYIIDTYRTALVEWGVDGFKLDFVGRFVANDSTVLELGGGRDYASVNEATDRLMTDVMASLREIDPHVMIEFRQPYIGPLMRKYGNMFRAGDAPNSGPANRVRTIDLRLLSGSTAVHSDMIMWHRDEPVENAALQFLNIIFSVPQVSVKLEEVPREHLAMIRFYTDYWISNRSVLLDGGLEASNPIANYTLVRAHSDSKQIFAAYDDVAIRLPANGSGSLIDILNAKTSGDIVLNSEANLGNYRYTTLDSQGREVESGLIELTQGVHLLSVPVAGLVKLERF